MLLNDLSARIGLNKQEIQAAVESVLDSGWVVLGPQASKFEESFAKYLGASHCVGLANGTDALEIALRAMGVKAGDQVATVANAGMYATTALLALGAEPLFMDVEAATGNVTPEEVERAIEAGVKVVIVTHLYGLAIAGIGEMARACAARGVKLLEDCAHAHGALIEGRRVGTFGDASCFSFYPTKNLGALGDGGAVVTNDAGLAQRVTRLRQYGWEEKYRVELRGGRNSRLDELQAAILLAFLPKLDHWNQKRRSIAQLYGAQISHPQVVTPATMGSEYVGHLYVVRSQGRDSLRRHLRGLGIASEVHYPIPDHRQPIFGDRYQGVKLPNTERLAAQILTLPCYPEMTEAQAQEVIAGVNGWQP